MRVQYFDAGQEPIFGMWDLNTFIFLKEENGIYDFRYVPRPYAGDTYAKGVVIRVDMRGIETWEQFEREILGHSNMIKCMFDEWRMGYTPEKVYYKLISWAEGWDFDDMPSELKAAASWGDCRVDLPKEYQLLVHSCVGDMPSYRPNR